MSSAAELTTQDRAVLGALFDPEASLGRGPSGTDAFALDSRTTAVPSDIAIAEQAAVRLLNKPVPSTQDAHSAIAQLTSIITTNPGYASACVNRAQAYRLLPGALTDTSITASIFSDLERAISLATPASTAVTPGLARILSSAHTHRGYLLLHASTHPSYFTLLQSLRLPLLHDIAMPAQLQELASRDFSIAGRYGNKTAQQLAVKTNPYAKLCGQIVKEALQRDIKEFYEPGVAV